MKKIAFLAVAVFLGLVVAACNGGAEVGRELIAFASDRDGDWEIYVMGSDGSGVVKLTDNAVHDVPTFFSPDGKRLVFYSYRDGDREIYVMGSDGSGVVKLTDNTAQDAPTSWTRVGE